MNKYDLSQLNFIMGMSDQDFDEWTLSMPLEDIQYAIELIHRYRAEQNLREQELLDNIEDSDLAEARSVLQKFML